MQQINVALSSYGMSGVVFHGPMLESHPGFKISKILERNRNVSSGKHPGAEIVRDFNAILNDQDIELVIVNTPDHLNFEVTRRVIEAGKHAVVEKPFTLKTEDADHLINLARKKGVLLTVYQNRRWDSNFLTVQEIIKQGKLGRLVDFESHFDRYRNYIQDSWKNQSNGTGTLYNLGSHLVDQILHLFGMPERLFCDSRMLRDEAKTDDSFDLFMHYPEFKCLVRSSYLVREPGPRFILHGTEGSYLKWGDDPQEEALKSGMIPTLDTWVEEPESAWGKINSNFNGFHLHGSYPTIPGNYMGFYDNIYEVIRHNAPLAVTPQQARDVIRVIEAAYESSRIGQVITLDRELGTKSLLV